MDHLKIDKIKERVISIDTTLIGALKQMDLIHKKLLFVVKDGLFHGLLSIGDIQRAILDNRQLDTRVMQIMRKSNIFSKTTDSLDQIKKVMFENRIECMPVLDDDNLLQDAYFWEDIFVETRNPKVKIGLPVVIMAGGKGSRLKPLTNV